MKLSKGFAAISSVLIIAVVITGLVVTAALNSIGEGQSALAVESGSADGYLADGCMEDILQKISVNATENTTSVTRPEGTCVITYAQSGPVNWDITVSDTGTNYGRKVRAVFTRGQTISISGWWEI